MKFMIRHSRNHTFRAPPRFTGNGTISSLNFPASADTMESVLDLQVENESCHAVQSTRIERALTLVRLPSLRCLQPSLETCYLLAVHAMLHMTPANPVSKLSATPHLGGLHCSLLGDGGKTVNILAPRVADAFRSGMR